MRLLKKALTILLILFILITSMNVMGTVFGSTPTSYKLAYKLNSDNSSLTVIGFEAGTYPTENYDLVIPAMANSYYTYDINSDKYTKHNLSRSLPVTAISQGAFTYTDITCTTKVAETALGYNMVDKIIWEGTNLKSIGVEKHLNTVKITSSNYVFDRCKNLTKLEIPDNVTSVGRIGSLLSGVTKVYFGKGIKSIDGRTLSNMTSCKTIYVYVENFKSSESIHSMRNLEEIYLYATTLTIAGKQNAVGIDGGNADKLRFYVKNDNIRNALTAVGYPAENIYDFPYETVVDMGEYSLKATVYKDKNYARIDGFKKSPEIFINLEIPSTINFENKNYPVTEIADYAFDSNTKDFSNNIRELNLPISVEKIGRYAFRGCSHMLHAYALGVKTVGAGAFKSCLELYHIELGEGLEAISSEMFYDCRALINLTVPSTVTQFSPSAVLTCRSIQSVAFLGENTEIMSGSFSGIGSQSLTGVVKFYVRTDIQKQTLTSRGIKQENIDLNTGSNVLVLYNGYNYDVSDVCAGEGSVVLPTTAYRKTQRFNLTGWSDGNGFYSPGATYTFGDKKVSALKGQWTINPSYTNILNVNEIKEAKPDDATMSQLINIEEVNTPEYEGNVNVRIVESETVNEIENANLFGVQFEISGSKFVNDEGELSSYYLSAANSGELGSIPVGRWGGDSTNGKNVYVNMRPYEQRESSINFNTGEVQNGPLTYGPVEFIKTVLATNPDAGFVFSISMLTMTPDESVKFYRILTDESGEYADIRTSCGIDKPINLIGFELGNEVYHDWSQVDNPWNGEKLNSKLTIYYNEENAIASDVTKLTPAQVAEAYTDVALTHIQALRAYAPDINLMPVLVNNTNLEEGMVWNRIIAKNLGSYVDTAVIHYYTGITVSSHKNENDTLNAIKQIFREEQGYKKDLQFALTEHALYSSNQQSTYLSLRACVSDAMFFNNHLHRDDILLANYHNFYGTTNWAYVQDMDGRFTSSGIADLYECFKQHLGDKAVKLEYDVGNVSSTSPVEASNVSAMIKGEDELVLVITNTKTLSQNKYIKYNYTFNFENNYKLVSETTFTAPNYYSYKVDSNSEDIFTVTTKTDFNGTASNVLNYTVEPCRVVFLRLKATTPIVSAKKAEPAESDNVVYRDLLGGAMVSDGIYEFTSADEVDRITYSGNNKDFTVYLRNTNGNWEKLTDYSEFTNESFYNKYTDKYYDAAKFENMSANDVVMLFTEVGSETEISADSGAFKLYPRINGVDCFDSYTPTGLDSSYLSFGNGQFNINKTGKTDITIGNKTFTVHLMKNGSKYSYSEDFQNWSAESTDWTGDFSVDKYSAAVGKDEDDTGDLGDDEINSNLLKPGDIDKKTNHMIIPVNNHSVTPYNAVYYSKDRTGLSDRQRIKFTASRIHPNQELGVRFMVHNDNKNYYQLLFKRKNGNGYTGEAWVLSKVTDGVSETLQTGMNYSGHNNGTGSATFTILVDRGNILWNATSSGIYSTYCGEYTDSEPFSLAGNNSTFGFFGYYYGALDTSNPADKILIDDISIGGLSNYDIEEHTIAQFGSTSNSDAYTLDYRLNSDNTLSVAGFAIYPNQEYVLDIPEKANYYYDSNNRLITLKDALPVTKISADAFSKGYLNNAGELMDYNTQNSNGLLKGVSVKNSIKTIESNAFAYCTNSSFTELEAYAQNISANAFVGCTNLATLNLHCNSLEITDGGKLSDSITLVNVRNNAVKNALVGKTDAEVKIYFEVDIPSADETYILNFVFDENGGTVTGFTEYPAQPVDLVIESQLNLEGTDYSVKKIADYAFANVAANHTKYGIENYNAVKTVEIKDGIETIGKYAFQNNNQKLTYVSIPGSVTSIGTGAFKNCIFITEVKLGDGIKTIPSEMFYGCQRLTTITVPSSVNRLYLNFVGGATNKLGEVVILSEDCKFEGNSLTSAGRDTNGTVYRVVNEEIADTLLVKAEDTTSTQPQTVELLNATLPSAAMENGILTLSNADGYSKSVSIVVAEYTDDMLVNVKDVIPGYGMYKDSKEYDLTKYKNGGYKVYVFDDTENLSPISSIMIP